VTSPGAAGAGRGELTIFAYPWDLVIDGVEESLRLARDLGADRLAVAVAYHSAEVVAPRRAQHVQLTAEANVSHFALAGDFSGLALPQGRLAASHPALAGQIGAAADAVGLKLTAWVVVCHNTGLAQQHPDAALENCFGDRSAHGLCPSNPVVRTYAAELCQQVAGIGIFDEIFIESVAFLPSGHGHPHELWAIRDDPASRYLRSLCFCASCVHLGAQRGIDGAQLRDFVARTLQSTWNSPLAPARDPDPGDELSGLLVARPDLAAWTAMRCDTVASLVGDLAAIAHDRGARLATGLGVFARPAPLGWIEGIDPARLAPAADRLVAMAYYAAAGAVARDLDHYSATVALDRIMLVQTLWPVHHASREVLLGKITLAKSAGVAEFGLYNLTTAPAAVLDWIPSVAQTIHGCGR